jgi:cysteine sulfinate desulfinase/cysteine desulfurase-like protein
MKLKSDVIDGALRVSFSRYSTQEESAYFVDKLKEAAQKLYKVL